jgi:hypothetical protein
MSFSIRLSSAAALQTALFNSAGKIVLRFETRAKAGRAHVTRPVPGHLLRRGSRLTLKVTVVRQGRHRTLTLPITVK